jgi:protein-L-isoaspartate(D-aspartate) O-methyltransferase
LAFVGEAPVMSAILITRHSHDYFQSQSLFETLVPMLSSAQTQAEVFEF